MFKEDEVRKLRASLDKFTGTVEFSLHGTGANEFGRRLESFVSEICRLSDGKCAAVADPPDFTVPASPCFTMGFRGRSNIVYAALPAGYQFPPFLKILETFGSGPPAAPGAGCPSIRSRAELLVLISGSCPRCPRAVEAAGLSACADPSILACVADVMQFQEFVKEYKIHSVPATVVDRKIVVTGTAPAGRIMELIRIRGTPEFEMERVRSLIDGRNIAEAARCLGRDAGRAVVLDLLEDVEFSKRLSALVVMEKAIEEDAGPVRSMVPSLLSLLGHSDARIRGDVADLLGKIGDPRAVPYLEPLIRDPDPDVAEAASDAISELKK
jgi:hypothetical protein